MLNVLVKSFNITLTTLKLLKLINSLSNYTPDRSNSQKLKLFTSPQSSYGPLQT